MPGRRGCRQQRQNLANDPSNKPRGSGVSEAHISELWLVAWRHLRSAIFCVGLVFLGACQALSESPTPAVPTAPMPIAPPAAQATHYAIRADLSDVRFLVYRAGRLADLGHNHVVQAKTITAEIYLATDFKRSNFSLVIPVTDFRVDAPEARSVEGEEFVKLPTAEAIAGTIKNMLGSNVLDAAHYPQIGIRSVSLVGPGWAPDVTVRIKLRGVERDITVPVAVDYRDDRLAVTAVFQVNQTDFGITPLSVLGGALQVANAIRVRIRIVAQKV
jgi:polyisoprenoid-binding protein YceI